ncbi:MAG: Thiosulfate dehydrogenase [Herbaspirillum frisingense]|uniref:Thiosulfate dehydrogenase n=1 Tax=Herbaspirillum frisingense TaxID=92645 RepID=A0A7V8FTQ0_9BURK|nr:MAG: Thiosulfate dehydrogenase [Herbaspirillum frisingense]
MASLPMSRYKPALAVACLAAVCVSAGAQTYGLGRPLGEREVAAWNIDVDADGAGLPAGSGNVTRGRAVYAQVCAACHGDKGQGTPADALVGGAGSLATAKPLKTIGSFWPYATTVFDFINRAMPYNAPKSLSTDDVYAVTAYLLYLNGIVGDNTTLDAATLPAVRMPNRDGFVGDTRPDTANVACRHCSNGAPGH